MRLITNQELAVVAGGDWENSGGAGSDVDGGTSFDGGTGGMGADDGYGKGGGKTPPKRKGDISGTPKMPDPSPQQPKPPNEITWEFNIGFKIISTPPKK